ncbi:Pisatin demethylase [Achaetomium macrosporum]|uniref:Cytochrome P450 monooxygenase ABA1 n=1 Tax=Achaetomium macrosporum TaxID=79813 RepID=A0AAN7CD00_9PEZI|nr:Pisatin demethylase [Achaetomium macrosporum]
MTAFLGLNIELAHASWVLLALAVASVAYVVSSFIAWWRLRHFNGPFSGSFSYVWLFVASFSGRMNEWFEEADARYGSGSSSTIRIGPNELLTSDPEVMRRTGAARSQYTRSQWYKLSTLNPYIPAMFNTLDTATHDKIKAQTAAGYAGKDIPSLEADIDAVLAEMVDKIRTKYASANSNKEAAKRPMLDLATMAQYFTLDSISQISFGEKFGMIREERDIYGHIALLHEIARPQVVIAGNPYFRTIVGSNLVLSLVGPKPGDKKGIGRMWRIAKPLVAKRFAPDAKDQPDMLGSFIRHGLTQSQCETEALFQIIAGSDTTATAIRCTMLYLMSTPRAYRALQAEIDQGIRTGRISSPITNAEANELPYLQGVILENLRLYPPFTGIPFKVVPPGGETIDGKHVPAGTLIAPNMWALGRNTDVFGPDADVFRPERWLDESVSAEERAEMRRVVELVFGYGRWGCAGKMIAFLELNKVFVELLRRFDFQLVYPYRPWKSVNFNLFLQHDMWVAVSLREEPQFEK